MIERKIIMSAIRQEIYDYIDDLPDSRLEALKPLLTLLVNDSFVIETNLTEGEKDLIRKGRERYKNNPASFVPLNNAD